MRWLFVDDAKQDSPGRPGMRPLVAVGGVSVAAEHLRPLSDAIEGVCRESGFPHGQEFKWSPGRELWMRRELVGGARQLFYESVTRELAAHGVELIIVLVDRRANPMHRGLDPEMDALLTLLERFHASIGAAGCEGVVVIDRPSGGRAQEASFLDACLNRLERGTPYVRFDRLAMPVMSADSRFVRLLQCADVVASCFCAYIAGESNYSPPVATGLKELLRSDGDRVGGYGVKIHPDFRYGNLYYWLFGDTDFWRAGVGVPMPLQRRPYSTGPNTP